jgi:hypothetical protein
MTWVDMFRRRKKTEGELEYERAQSDGINCRNTQRLVALLAGNLTRDGYKPGTQPSDPDKRLL